MKIAIMGAGMAGAYLCRLLCSTSHDVDLFDLLPRTRCGIDPCGWGTSRGFEELVAASGLDPSGYILSRFDHIMLDGFTLRGYFLTVDKVKLIHDLLDGVEVTRDQQPDMEKYDRIIDATGAVRAFLPPIPDDFVLTCIQSRVRSAAPVENCITLGKIGYAWSFPLGPGEHHIGCGCLRADPRAVLRDLGWLKTGTPGVDVVCGCSGRIRLTSPSRSLPFVTRGKQEVWGVGEALGCVAPLAGDGMVPSMKSVQILMDHWDDPAGYEKAILKEFKWMETERRVLDKLINEEALTVKDHWVLVRDSKRMGIRVGLRDAAGFLNHLR